MISKADWFDEEERTALSPATQAKAELNAITFDQESLHVYFPFTGLGDGPRWLGNIVKYLSRNKCLSRGFLWRVR